MEEKSTPTSTPPGRLIDDRFNTESKRELVSTFHLFCCTLATMYVYPDIQMGCTTKKQKEGATSIILPTTTSPISPLYLGKGEILHKITMANDDMARVPRLQRRDADQFIDSFYHSRNGRNQLPLGHVGTMASETIVKSKAVVRQS